MKLNKQVPDKEDNTYTLTALTIQMSSQQVVLLRCNETFTSYYNKLRDLTLIKNEESL